MKDSISAMRGRRHCDWCNEKGATWWERFMRFDQILSRADRPLYERLALHWADFNTDRLQIWRLGQWWHFRYHIK